MHRTVRHFAQRDERLKLAKVIILTQSAWYRTARPFLQPAGTYLCAAHRFSAARRPALLCSPPVRVYVQPAGPLCCAARLLVQPSGALCCAARPNVQLAGPPCFGPPFSAARRPAENSYFSIGNTAFSPPGPPALRLVSSRFC